MIYPNALLAEQAQVQLLFAPVNIQTAGNAPGEWVSMENFEKMTIIFAKGAGKAGEDPVLKLQQATDIAGSGAKPLTFTRLDVKKGGISPGVAAFTKVSQAAGATYSDATSAEVEGLWVLEVNADQLDRANGFDCVNFSISGLSVSPPTQAQVGVAIGILWGARYGGAHLPSAIAD